MYNTHNSTYAQTLTHEKSQLNREYVTNNTKQIYIQNTKISIKFIEFYTYSEKKYCKKELFIHQFFFILHSFEWIQKNKHTSFNIYIHKHQAKLSIDFSCTPQNMFIFFSLFPFSLVVFCCGCCCFHSFLLTIFHMQH